MSGKRMITLPFLLLALSPFIFDSDYPLISCLSHRPFGIFLWYLVEMYNRIRRCVAYKNDNSAFLTFGVISLCNI